MIEDRFLTPMSVMPAEGVVVLVAVEVDGKRFFMGGKVVKNQWVCFDPALQLPAKRHGWTGHDSSWKTKPWNGL